VDRNDALAAEFAVAHRGLLPGAELRRIGFTTEMVRHRVETGRWKRLARDLFVVAGAPHSSQQDITAAVLVGPPGTTASFLSAGAVWQLTEPGPRPMVSVPHGRSARNPLATVHRADLDPRDVTLRAGVPVTRIPRTLLDLATILRPKALERVVDTALSEKRVSLRGVEAAIERAPAGLGRKGVTPLREALKAWTDPIKPGSAAEARLIRQIGSWGLPDPARQHVVCSLDGVPFARLDLAWPAQLVGLEYDGVKHHNPRHIERDEGRQAALEALGWHVMHADRCDLGAGDGRLRGRLGALLRRTA
jgi:hypothetical protein